MIEVVDAVKKYRRGTETLTVLDQISISVAEGEFVALMGPSGSGKTTLLNLVAGLDKPDSGQVVVCGQDLKELSESGLAKWRVRNIGFVFQFYNLLPVLTAAENVALPLSLLSMTKSERYERARFALDVVGLGDRLDHLPSQLSGGQEQRVAIARAIVTDPRLIVADEPTGDLDRHSAAEVLGILRTLNEEHKKTVLMVTHDPAAAEYAKRRVIFDKGSIKES